MLEISNNRLLVSVQCSNEQIFAKRYFLRLLQFN